MPAKKKAPAKGHSPQSETAKKGSKKRNVSANTVRKQGASPQPTRTTSIKKSVARKAAPKK